MRLLVKLRPQTSLNAANPRVSLRPLFESPVSTPSPSLTDSSQAWFIADAPDHSGTPWDAAHNQLAAGLGVAPGAILFAEPDLPQSWPAEPVPDSDPAHPQHSDQRPAGPGFAWHTGDAFSQLASAGAAVSFNAVRTRIAHIDTGYNPRHTACPTHILSSLQRNFVDGDGNPNDATDPNRNGLFDVSGHGTGTIGILAAAAYGGAPGADILPIRIANSPVLFYASNFARAVQYAVQQQCDVLSISMGGLPSAAWREAVSAAYEAGILVVAAAGDCFGGLPSHHVVYPARYHCVLAACGVMANGAPYYDLPIHVIEGSFGPDSSMTQALAAWTPNTPWARLRSSDIVDMDGGGTSSATPQIAAAATLWLEKYKVQLPRDWRRVEAVRNALFRSARNTDPTHFGNGILQARAALDVAPRLDLAKAPEDNDAFPFFRVITGLGLAAADPREQMLSLELSQRYLRNKDMAEAIREPAATPDLPSLRRFLDALIADPEASQTLRRAASSRYPDIFGPSRQVSVPGRQPLNAVIPRPVVRRLRAYTLDPSFSGSLATSAINQSTLEVRWEKLDPGPVGEYVEVVDPDYAPADLNDPLLLACDGFAPSEGNPQFHQQSVYATAMATIGHFEAAIGRRVHWSGGVPRLAILPHAFTGENAFYDPEAVALRFGCFRASEDDAANQVPGSTVFTCMSQDIVAHETAHAILDGMHRGFIEPTNPDTLAFHEGFADIVALLQRFTNYQLLEDQISRCRGNLDRETVLGSLATQFGRATGARGALRQAIGFVDAAGKWHRNHPDPASYRNTLEPHKRGALLVAAVFDALLAIYRRRTDDLFRIYAGGTGGLKRGAIHPDLVHRLAREANRSARHVLHMCIRALDYLPPVDLTFGEYLRGLITADHDLYSVDEYGYRIAVVEAFRRRGIYPRDVETLSVERLLWEPTDIPATPTRDALLSCLKAFAEDAIYTRDRDAQFKRSAAARDQVKALLSKSPDLAPTLGIDRGLDFEVTELRCAHRAGPCGEVRPEAVVAIIQRRDAFSGGSTLIIDLYEPCIKYGIRKTIANRVREQETKEFIARMQADPLTTLLLSSNPAERFAALHGGF
jgi:subtilisin family serine protease